MQSPEEHCGPIFHPKEHYTNVKNVYVYLWPQEDLNLLVFRCN